MGLGHSKITNICVEQVLFLRIAVPIGLLFLEFHHNIILLWNKTIFFKYLYLLFSFQPDINYFVKEKLQFTIYAIFIISLVIYKYLSLNLKIAESKFWLKELSKLTSYLYTLTWYVTLTLYIIVYYTYTLSNLDVIYFQLIF